MTGRLSVQVLPSGKEQVFGEDRAVVIGRDATADVVVDYERASRHHAVVRPDAPAGWVLEDQSTNGTFSSGQRVTTLALNGPTIVQLGDPVIGVAVRLSPAVVKPDGQVAGGQRGAGPGGGASPPPAADGGGAPRRGPRP